MCIDCIVKRLICISFNGNCFQKYQDKTNEEHCSNALLFLQKGSDFHWRQRVSLDAGNTRTKENSHNEAAKLVGAGPHSQRSN